MKKINIKAFVNSYLHTASWVTCDSGENTKFTREAKKEAAEDCQIFIDKVISKFGAEKGTDLLAIPGNDLEYLAAHDLFLTRNHHGAGFWDKGSIYGEGEALDLTELAHQMKEKGCYHIRGNSSPLIFE
jgi:hypothetical protein